MSHSEYIGNELELFSKARNWKQYWCSKVKPFLGEKVLEVGAGIGTNTHLLFQQNMQWTALEPDQIQAQLINSNPPTAAGSTLIVKTGTTAELDQAQTFNTIIYIDVLEHIEDDTGELARAWNLLAPNGKLVVLSPAHQSLYSPFDKHVGHFRRYNKSSLLAAKPTNAIVEKIFYLDSVGYIASWVNAKLLKSAMPTTKQIWFWDTFLVSASKYVDRVFGYSIGKTIVMVLKR